MTKGYHKKMFVLFLLFLILILLPSIQALDIQPRANSYFNLFEVSEILREINSTHGLVKGEVKTSYTALKGDGEDHSFNIYMRDGNIPVSLDTLEVGEDPPSARVSKENFYLNKKENFYTLTLDLKNLFKDRERDILHLKFNYSYLITLNKNNRAIRNLRILSSCHNCKEYSKDFILPFDSEPINKEWARYRNGRWILNLPRTDTYENTIVYKNNLEEISLERKKNFKWAFFGAVLGTIFSFILFFVYDYYELKIKCQKWINKLKEIFQRKTKSTLKLSKSNIEEHKAVNTALSTGFVVVAFVTAIELIEEAIREFLPAFTSWLGKLTLLILLYLAVNHIVKNTPIKKKRVFKSKKTKS